MVPCSAAVAAEIRRLLHGVTESNFQSSLLDLQELIDYGREGCLLLLQACLNDVKQREVDTQNLPVELEFKSAVFRHMLDKVYFSTCLYEVLGTLNIGELDLESLSRILKLSLAEKIGIGLALSDSEDPKLRLKGQNFSFVQIEELCSNSDILLSNERIQDIVMFLFRNDGLSKHMDTFTRLLSLLNVKEMPFFVPVSGGIDNCSSSSSRYVDLIFSGSDDDDFESVLSEIEKELTMADIITELGYGSTVDSKRCKEILSLFQPLDDFSISKLLGAIACTYTGLHDSHSTYFTMLSSIGNTATSEGIQMESWNIEVLVQSINELAPRTNWVHVIKNFDHEGFNIPDESAFHLLMMVYSRACQEPFPLHAVCGSVWKNTEGQLSFLKYAVSAPADIFTFAHCSRQMSFPEFVHDKQGNQAWLCLDLLEVLCHLAELGHASLIRLMLEYPLTLCPDVLLLGVGHISTPYNLLQCEVTSRVFPILLKDPMKVNVISHLWSVNKNLTLRGFVDTHFEDDCLLRIVEISHDLKVLSSVVDSTSFPFNIKVASVASRKEYMNLENWLNECLTLYKDSFFEECVKFVKEAISFSESALADTMVQQLQNSVYAAYYESLPTFFKVLQYHCGKILSSINVNDFKELQSMYAAKYRSLVGAASASDLRSDDIETEANNYFQQMFSGQLSIDSMVLMLARFKESSDQREQDIFSCMIANLFEEYKFFPKYPDKQLKLAAVLFGSLIKHQLVNHLTLGIALRGVLDALRKSVDSRMFMFGTRALEQFMDRLVEWPQYCNHIMQISHLRGTHPELVSVIERALARISSSQSETNGGTPVSAEQHLAGSAVIENIETSETSWQQLSSTSPQFGRQLSPLQVQQRHQSFLGEKLKVSNITTNQTKPAIHNIMQPSGSSSSVDMNTNRQPSPLPGHHLPATTAANVASTGFLRSRTSAPSGIPRQPSYMTGFGSALNIETLVAAAERRDTPIEAPPSDIQDKILFMINNISTSNMESKAKEFTEVLQEQYYPWFAQYMVMKRASIEPNFHDLYLKFFDKVNSKLLNKEIIKATYENCKVLLRSDLIKSSSEERSLLKNLGSWLGKFTIGRNQALRAKEIDPKILIVEAYEKGLMIAVIPFTSKILEPCQASIAYRPPNPWTMGILSLLAEIYNLPNLKMNLKFDIEVLFKNLGVEMKEVKPTSLLKDRIREIEGNPDFSNKDVSASQSSVVTDVAPAIISLNHVELQPEINNTSRAVSIPSVLNQYTSPVHLPSSNLVEDEKLGSLILPEPGQTAHSLTQVSPSPTASPSSSSFSLNQLLTSIPRADMYYRINPKLTSMGSQLQFSQIIEIAMEKAVREIITPVIQRSVTIASRTTKELILKDYAMESDDSNTLRSARLMVGSLAGSLAHVTCKEPLRVSLSSNLRTHLQKSNSNGETIEQIIQILINDHLDLGCALIESVATRKAVEIIDGEIVQSFSLARKQREAAGSAYYDAFTHAQSPYARLPELLRPKPGQLAASQQRVYEDFTHLWQTSNSQKQSTVNAFPATATSSLNSSSIPRVYSPGSVALSTSNFSTVPVGSYNPAAQPADLTEEAESVSAQLSSMPSQSGAVDSGVQQLGSISMAISSYPSSSVSNDLPSAEASNVGMELGPLVSPSPSTVMDRLGSVLPEPLTTGDALDRYEQVSQKLESFIERDAQDSEIQAIIAEVPEILVKCVSRDEAALAMAQKVFKSLYDSTSNKVYVSWLLAILVAIRDVCKLVVKELTSWVIYSDEEKKFNVEITIGLVRSELLNLGDYNVHLAKLIDGGRNKAATEFSVSLVQALATHDSALCIAELHNVMDALTKVAMRPGSPESLQQLIDSARNNVNNSLILTGTKDDKIRQEKDKKQVLSLRPLGTKEDDGSIENIPMEMVGFQEQVAALFMEWCRICNNTMTESTSSQFISQLQLSGLLRGDDVMDLFFRSLTELAVAHSINESTLVSPLQQEQISYFPIDSYAKLVVAVLKYCLIDQGSSMVALFGKILSVTVRVIQKESEEKKLSFNPRPYFRLFIDWLSDLVNSDTQHDSVNIQILTSFANAFHALQPLKVPGWSFAWLELVSHRSFMPKLLKGNPSKGWPFFQRLLVDHFKFMEPYLRNAELQEPIHFLYKGTLRVLLVLLHDFPEFLCDYHFNFCDVIPSSCIQMRNVILSAYPRQMRLPDPSTPNLKIDLLPEIKVSPRILSDVDGSLKAKQIKGDIDEYLKTGPEGSSFLTDLKQKLLLAPGDVIGGSRYNVPLINSLVLYIGMQAIQQLQSKSSSQHASLQQMNYNPFMDIFLASSAMDIFQNLINTLDTEGRYIFLNALANQLRYPNNHTHYFSFIILFLFDKANQEIIQEQITRVLLERLIVNRPHPWGLLITFIELIKNPRYNFWNRSFTRIAPELEKLFESVARSCGGKSIDEGMVPGIPDVSH